MDIKLPEEKPKIKRATFTLSELEIQRLKEISSKTGMSASAWIRAIINQAWEKYNQE